MHARAPPASLLSPFVISYDSLLASSATFHSFSPLVSSPFQSALLSVSLLSFLPLRRNLSPRFSPPSLLLLHLSRSAPFRSLLFLFTSLFALSPFSSSESGLIHWKLFICLIATRRPGSSTLRRGNLRPRAQRRGPRHRACGASTPIPIRGVTTTSFAFHSVTTRHSREKHFVNSRSAIVSSPVTL